MRQSRHVIDGARDRDWTDLLYGIPTSHEGIDGPAADVSRGSGDQDRAVRGGNRRHAREGYRVGVPLRFRDRTLASRRDVRDDCSTGLSQCCVNRIDIECFPCSMLAQVPNRKCALTYSGVSRPVGGLCLLSPRDSSQLGGVARVGDQTNRDAA